MVTLCVAPILVVWTLHETNANVVLRSSSLAGFMPRILVQEQQLIDTFGTPSSVTTGKDGQKRYVFDHLPRFASVLVGSDSRIAEVFVSYSDDSEQQLYQTGKGIGAQSMLDDVLRVYGKRCSRRFERNFMGSGDATVLTYRDKELRIALEFTFRQIDPYSQSKEQCLMDIRFYKE